METTGEAAAHTAGKPVLMTETVTNLRCTFCGKAAKKLIAGPAVYICDECVGLCNDIFAAEGAEGAKGDASEGAARRRLHTFYLRSRRAATQGVVDECWGAPADAQVAVALALGTQDGVFVRRCAEVAPSKINPVPFPTAGELEAYIDTMLSGDAHATGFAAGAKTMHARALQETRAALAKHKDAREGNEARVALVALVKVIEALPLTPEG